MNRNDEIIINTNKSKTEEKEYDHFFTWITIMPFLLFIVYIIITYIEFTTYNLWTFLLKQFVETTFIDFAVIGFASPLIIWCFGIIVVVGAKVMNFFKIKTKIFDYIDSKITLAPKQIFIMIIILTFIFECIKKEDTIIINYKECSRIQYKYEILVDSIKQTTKTVTLASNEIKTSRIRKTTRARRGHSSRTYYKYYVKYISEDGEIYKYSSKETEYICNIIDTLKTFEDNITIGYYSNSGIIKEIDGIDKYDTEKINQRIESLKMQKLEEEQAELEKKQREQEQQQKEIKERQEMNKKINDILKKAIGTSFESIKIELDDFSEFKYEIKNISTKYYKIGEVAFIKNSYSKNEITTIYVVNSNKNEEMVEMPKLMAGMPEEEAIKMLQESGFEYSVSRFTSYNNEPKGTLKYYQYSPRNVIAKRIKCSF